MKKHQQSGLTQEDIEIWERYIRSPEGFKISKSSKVRPRAAISKKLDLHGMTVQQAFEATNLFLESHFKSESKGLVIVCGKGGQIANEVTYWCENSGLVRACNPIFDSMGEIGAYRIILQRSTAMR